MKVLYANFDGLTVAFKGALPVELLDALAAARAEAETRDEPISVELGPKRKLARVFQSGLRGGYRYRLDTGSDELLLCLKHNLDPNQWNFLFSVFPGCLVERGYFGAKALIFETAEALGITLGEESISRVDYAVDVEAPEFKLDPKLFVAPKGTKNKVIGDSTVATGELPYYFVTTGRDGDTMTIGQMPGRQVTVYNKRKQAIEKQKLFWFEVWGIDPEDSTRRVFRAEVRLGKRELKDRWAMTTFEELEAALGDAILDAVESIRMVAPDQTDSNVTRQTPHPFWTVVTGELKKGLAWARAGLVRGQVRLIERAQAIQHSDDMTFAYAARRAILQGEPENGLLDRLGHVAAKSTSSVVQLSRANAIKRLEKVRDRLRLKVRN